MLKKLLARNLQRPTNKTVGNAGERIAANYLRKKGHKILDRNYHTRYGEIDIVSRKDNILHFVEVKTRNSTKYGLPEEAVGTKKLSSLFKAIKLYTMDKGVSDIPIKVLVVSLLYHQKGNCEIKIISLD